VFPRRSPNRGVCSPDYVHNLLYSNSFDFVVVIEIADLQTYEQGLFCSDLPLKATCWHRWRTHLVDAREGVIERSTIDPNLGQLKGDASSMSGDPSPGLVNHV